MRDRCWSDAERMYPPPPERLIIEERHNDGGDAGAQTGRCRARAAVMNHNRHAREEPVMGRGS